MSSDYVVFDVGYGCESVPVVERFLHVVFVARVTFILVVFLSVGYERGRVSEGGVHNLEYLVEIGFVLHDAYI